jgi:hypothetical protein
VSWDMKVAKRSFWTMAAALAFGSSSRDWPSRIQVATSADEIYELWCNKSRSFCRQRDIEIGTKGPRVRLDEG